MNPYLSKFYTLFSTFNTAVVRSINLRSKYPNVSSVDQFLRQHGIPRISNSTTLDLGCGHNIRNPFGASCLFGVDIQPNTIRSDIKAADLSIYPIPYPGNSFNYCTAYDFIEHIPRLSWPNGCARYSFIELMNEVYRVLLPNGYFSIKYQCIRRKSYLWILRISTLSPKIRSLTISAALIYMQIRLAMGFMVTSLW